MRSIRSANTRYATNPPPVDPKAFGEWAQTELIQLSEYVQAVADGQYEKQHAAPSKLKPGMIRYADGSDWAPGQGEGLYFYIDEWKRLLSVGSGGTVTQATSKSTAVTLNKETGEITLNNAALNLDTAVTFTLNNSTLRATDLLVVNHVSGGTAGAYLLTPRVTAAGTATITVRNVTTGNLSEAAVIRFTRVPGATT